MSEKKKPKITYPRHWWFSCNKFTCYVQTDKDNKITRQSAPIVRAFVGQAGKKLSKWVQRKFGGLHITEFDSDGNSLPPR
jgi:hypothetical protein